MFLIPQKTYTWSNCKEDICQYDFSHQEHMTAKICF